MPRSTPSTTTSDDERRGRRIRWAVATFGAAEARIAEAEAAYRDAEARVSAAYLATAGPELVSAYLEARDAAIAAWTEYARRGVARELLRDDGAPLPERAMPSRVEAAILRPLAGPDDPQQRALLAEIGRRWKVARVALRAERAAAAAGELEVTDAAVEAGRPLTFSPVGLVEKWIAAMGVRPDVATIGAGDPGQRTAQYAVHRLAARGNLDQLNAYLRWRAYSRGEPEPEPVRLPAIAAHDAPTPPGCRRVLVTRRPDRDDPMIVGTDGGEFVQFLATGALLNALVPLLLAPRPAPVAVDVPEWCVVRTMARRASA